MFDEDEQRAILQPGERVGGYVLQTACDLEWTPRCVAMRDGQSVELAFFELHVKPALFERECRLLLRVLGSLAHPNIRIAHEIGIFETFGWIALEPVVRPMLPTKPEPPRPWQHVREQMRAVGAAVLAMQGAGLRVDFGRDDISIDREGHVRVDFVSAYAFFLARRCELPSPYQAPESWQNLPATTRSHQFVFCMIYWEALFAVLPFPGGSIMELATSVIGAGCPRRRPTAMMCPAGWSARSSVGSRKTRRRAGHRWVSCSR